MTYDKTYEKSEIERVVKKWSGKTDEECIELFHEFVDESMRQAIYYENYVTLQMLEAAKGFLVGGKSQIEDPDSRTFPDRLENLLFILKKHDISVGPTIAYVANEIYRTWPLVNINLFFQTVLTSYYGIKIFNEMRIVADHVIPHHSYLDYNNGIKKPSELPFLHLIIDYERILELLHSSVNKHCVIRLLDEQTDFIHAEEYSDVRSTPFFAEYSNQKLGESTW